jgi:hypothetical protein
VNTTIARSGLALGVALVLLGVGLTIRVRATLVFTPGGPRDPALVALVEPGRALRELDGVLRIVDESGVPVDPPIDVARLDDDRAALESGWITYTHFSNRGDTPITYFSTTWVVPPPPQTARRQTIFLFNGLQNDGTNHGILQPVLQWGVSAAGGGPYWSVASWYVTTRGQAFHTPLVRVEPGQTLVGVMTRLDGTRDRGTYTSEILGIPRSRLKVKNLRTLFWATESLEAYAVRRCSDYPTTSAIPFTAIELRTDRHPSLRWQIENRVRDCGQHAVVVRHSAEDGHVELRFRR